MIASVLFGSRASGCGGANRPKPLSKFFPDATACRFADTDVDASGAALEGVEVLLMVSAPEGPERFDQHRTFIESAAASGVPHVVYTSFIDASPESTFTLGRDHYVTEEHIKLSGMDYT